MIISREEACGHLDAFAKLPSQTVLSVLAADLARTVVELWDKLEDRDMGSLGARERAET